MCILKTIIQHMPAVPQREVHLYMEANKRIWIFLLLAHTKAILFTYADWWMGHGHFNS